MCVIRQRQMHNVDGTLIAYYDRYVNEHHKGASMLESYLASVFRQRRSGLAMVLGTNEIASAVAVHLERAGFGVVLSHDPNPPVIRRGMAFHDALWGEIMEIEGIRAEPADRASEVLAIAALSDRVAVTRLGLADLMVLAPFDLIVDARLHKYATTPDLLPLARLSIGLGPGFTAGVDCTLAVETRPARTIGLLTRGTTAEPDGVPELLAGIGEERFARAAHSGRWHTAMPIGARVYRGMAIGRLDCVVVKAPIDGVVRGLVRDGFEVCEGDKLIEIDPRNRWQVKWSGIDARARAIAETVAMAAWDHLPDARAEPVADVTPEPEPETRRRAGRRAALDEAWWLPSSEKTDER